ncbi:calcium-transporting ATPase type 2C member 1-like isoform X5 [Diaphorina citri]|uniref:Calcium-transporting ATPase type 2C member 1-like isoform X5 n=1 Tax=Diaphorina citri TaxID=121845 RepID=A0A3Q0JKF2_DIACI|nr:calcium-transporting ATPase type 2C member 1-like isoform X5 [Diaphorina citri]
MLVQVKTKTSSSFVSGKQETQASKEEMWLTTNEASLMGAEEVAARLRVDCRSGLWWKEAELRRQLIGYNEFCVKEEDPLWRKYIEQFKNPLILLLLASALVSVFMKQFDDAISITVVSSHYNFTILTPCSHG